MCIGKNCVSVVVIDRNFESVLVGIKNLIGIFNVYW